MRELTAGVGGCCLWVLVSGLAACGSRGASPRGADTAAAPAAPVDVLDESPNW